MQLPELLNPNDPQPSVFLADVTSNVVDARTGYKATSFISTCSPGHSVNVVMASVIKREDYATFHSELEFLIELDTNLPLRRTTWFVDGDKGRIKAIRGLLPLAEIHLCWWHKENNIIDHFAKAIKKHGPKDLTVAELVSSIRARGVKCNPGWGRDKLKAKLDELMEMEETPEGGSGHIAGTGEEEEEESGELGSEDDLIAPSTGLLRFTSPKEVFRYIRSGESLVDTLARLERVKESYPEPELIRYIDEELKSTLKYWANAFRVWNLCFGLSTSTMQESIHWSLKARLKGKSVFAHMLPAFLIKTLERRAVNVERKRVSGDPLSKLRQRLELQRGRMMVASMEPVNLEGQDYVLRQFDRALGKVAKEIQSNEVNQYVSQKWEGLLAQEGASLHRFWLVVESFAESETPGRLFAVTQAEAGEANPGKLHLVFVLPNGSFCCSCGDVASWGAPDRHVFAVVLDGGAVFAPLVHLQRSYLRPEALSEQNKLRWTACNTEGHYTPNEPGPNASWDEAYELTKERWDREGLGKDTRAPTAYSPIKPASTRLDKTKQMRTAFHELLDWAKKDDTVRVQFLEFVSGMREQVKAGARPAVVHFGDTFVALPPPLAPASSHPFPSSATHRLKASAKKKHCPGE